jgi:hypothetical protein
LSGTLGWLPVSGLAIAVLVVGFKLRRLLDNLTTMMRPGAGSIMLGGLARRGAMGAISRITNALTSRGASPTPADRSKDRLSPTEASSQRVTSVRVYRQAPAVGALSKPSAASSPYELTTGGERRRSAGSSGPGGGGPAGQNAAGETGRSEGSTSPGRATAAMNLSRAYAQSKDGGRRTISVSAPIAPAGGSTASSSRGASADAQKARHSRRPQSSSLSETRYEPRLHTPSASLRDGPPKGPRSPRRSPSQQQRRFREYSAITKDGVTVHVPTRR